MAIEEENFRRLAELSKIRRYMDAVYNLKMYKL